MRQADTDYSRGVTMPRSRGAVSGLLLVILGAWGALIPFVGPHFDFAYTPDRDWAWTSARGWLEVLPGVVTAIGGLLLIFAGNRITAMLGGWLAVMAGAWFVVGEQFAPLLKIGSAGDPVAATDGKRAVLEISYFSGLGALIVFVGGVVLARTAIRHARDVQRAGYAEPAEREAAVPRRDPAYVSGLEDSPEEVSSDALTKPRVARYGSGRAEPLRGWRRPPAGPGSPYAAYLRWPHPH